MGVPCPGDQATVPLIESLRFVGGLVIHGTCVGQGDGAHSLCRHEDVFTAVTHTKPNRDCPVAADHDLNHVAAEQLERIGRNPAAASGNGPDGRPACGTGLSPRIGPLFGWGRLRFRPSRSPLRVQGLAPCGQRPVNGNVSRFIPLHRGGNRRPWRVIWSTSSCTVFTWSRPVGPARASELPASGSESAWAAARTCRTNGLLLIHSSGVYVLMLASSFSCNLLQRARFPRLGWPLKATPPRETLPGEPGPGGPQPGAVAANSAGLGPTATASGASASRPYRSDFSSG